MAAFASDRRSPGIRFLIIFLALIMAFSAVSLPVYALSESVALFGLAAVLSSATAALGFKLTNNQQGIDTINRMCADFIKSALAPSLVVIGTRVNGLQNDMAYIKMQVANAKTYLDERVLAWVQQWLSKDGVYADGTVTYPDYKVGDYLVLSDLQLKSFSDVYNLLKSNISMYQIDSLMQHYNLDSTYLNDKLFDIHVSNDSNYASIIKVYEFNSLTDFHFSKIKADSAYPDAKYIQVYLNDRTDGTTYTLYKGKFSKGTTFASDFYLTLRKSYDGSSCDISNISGFSLATNNTGLSGSDTIGEDYKDKTLEQILQGLKEKAPDWYDAGADSSTNSAVGAKDLPVTVPAGAASENPALNPDAVYNPPFDQPLDDTRSGATSSTTVADGVTNANTAESSEAAAATVTETQTIIDSLINWANNYISPDKGLFSKFPLCIPYDAYLLVSSALGVDARDISDIVNTEQSDLSNLSIDESVVNSQADFVPVVDIQHDFELDGKLYPIRITFDLSPYEPLIKLNRIFLSIALIAELIGSEYKRIRGEK